MIEINNLTFSYGHTKVFENISLSFRPGNIYGLLGENGVGKTTLLKIVCGLQRPQQGSCKVDGFVCQDRQPQFLQNIVFLPDAVALPAGSTPRSYVHELQPFYPNYAEGTFLHLMRELEVAPQRKFSQMSFGQQKKSLLACALSLGTDYVLLDEPTNGLDIPSKTQLRSILSKRVQEQTTIIIATHQVKDVENLIDPIIIITADDVLINATISEITDQLYFEYGATARPDALYSEAQPGGCLNVVRNETGAESQVNIEALFNAVLQNKNAVKDLFANKKSEQTMKGGDNE